MFSIAKFFIDRPVFSIVINTVITLLGIVCLVTNKIIIREFPNIEEKTLSINMEYSGASVEVMESQIANKFEEVLSSVEGLQDMRTNITQGNCNIRMSFGPDRNIDSAANDVESKLRRIRSDLPENLREPTITKADPNAAPAIELAMFGGQYRSTELGDILNRYVKSELESIAGVATVEITGQTGTSFTYAIDIFMKPESLAAYKLTADEVHGAVSSQSFVQPAGSLIIGEKTYNITTKANLTTLDEFGDIVVSSKNGKIVRVRDVADIQFNDDDKKQRTRYNGQVVALARIRLQAGANILKISETVDQKIQELRKSLPDRDLQLKNAYDKSIYINSAVQRLYSTIIEAIILVAIIILLFLKSFRATVIPLVTVPICLASGLFIIYIFGFTLNVATLLAMLLAVGLVVDDAVVVLEIVVEKMESGLSAVQASIEGLQEIQSSIVGMTLTLVSVYLPISLLSGSNLKFFNEFAVTLAGMVLVSGIVAFILTPMMSAYILKPMRDRRVYPPIEFFNVIFDQIKLGYGNLLKICLNNSLLVISGAFAIFLLSLLIGKQFLIQIGEPEADRGVISIELSTKGMGIDTVAPILADLDLLKDDPIIGPSIDGLYSSFTNSDKTEVFFILANNNKSRYGLQYVRDYIKNKYDTILTPFMPRYGVDNSSPLGGGSDNFSVTVTTNKDYDQLEDMGTRLSQVLYGMPAPFKTKNILASRTRPETTYNLDIDRERAHILEINIEQIRKLIRMITRGNPPADRYEKEGRQYPVRLWISDLLKRDPNAVGRFLVRTNKRSKITGDYELAFLKEVLTLKESTIRPLIQHKNGQRSYDLYCDFVNKDADAITAYRVFEARALKELGPGFALTPSQRIQKLIAEGNITYIIYALAIIFAYLVMAAQFESLSDPLLVLLTIPLAISWAIISLVVFPDGSLNAYSTIGILTLMGLIIKNGILLVEFFNQKRQEVRSLKQAAFEAALERFRPIVMTTLAMVLGAVPLILSKGAGHEGPRQVGIVLVGGLSLGTVMTVFVVPCLCVNLAEIRRKVKGTKALPKIETVES